MEKLQSTCLVLLTTTQSHPIGFSSLRTGIDDNSSLLTRPEKELLDRYDALARTTLWRHTVEAELAAVMEGEPREIEGLVEDLERELAEASANRALKESAVEAVLVNLPVSMAIHSNTTTATRAQQAIAPLLSRRDALAQIHGRTTTALKATQEELMTLQRSIQEARIRNRELAARVLELSAARDAEERRRRGPEEVSAQRELEMVRAHWEAARNVVQAIVAASGVDWVRDRKLRELVLACGEEEEE